MFENLNFGRIVAWVAAIVAILNAAVFALTPLAGQYPALQTALLFITSITALITPFLPRAQGKPNAEVAVVEKKF